MNDGSIMTEPSPNSSRRLSLPCSVFGLPRQRDGGTHVAKRRRETENERIRSSGRTGENLLPSLLYSSPLPPLPPLPPHPPGINNGLPLLPWQLSKR